MPNSKLHFILLSYIEVEEEDHDLWIQYTPVVNCNSLVLPLDPKILGIRYFL
jgi:hypothetical protein